MFIGFKAKIMPFLTMLCMFFDMMLWAMLYDVPMLKNEVDVWHMTINGTQKIFIVDLSNHLMFSLFLLLIWGGRGVWLIRSSAGLLRASRVCAWFIEVFVKILRLWCRVYQINPHGLMISSLIFVNNDSGGKLFYLVNWNRQYQARPHLLADVRSSADTAYWIDFTL